MNAKIAPKYISTMFTVESEYAIEKKVPETYQCIVRYPIMREVNTQLTNMDPKPQDAHKDMFTAIVCRDIQHQAVWLHSVRRELQSPWMRCARLSLVSGRHHATIMRDSQLKVTHM